ncbi:MAG TPA: hypothetical protein IGS53_26380 [Leptolyngbyaceae cyanobacterium M33_DOE_097]|uniref:Uncharacterized protein n=1 Tax=Oscillatoriales cyanobacterium SpSt-418 TaxID=2282169 RepID=A0A7C3KD49_9CYAN|nr:hypothetical protein [Leptolyngbyaceae cyanobacterium M33_DOE_097]
MKIPVEFTKQIQYQRVKHIVDSYCLEGCDPLPFEHHLKKLLEIYPSYVVELALVEVLVAQWMRVPMQRGCRFLAEVEQHLHEWMHYSNRDRPLVPYRITAEQFQTITGLDPTPVFNAIVAFSALHHDN